VFRGVPSERHLNPLGGVHGGGQQRCSIQHWHARCRHCLRRARPTRRPNSR
jgi:hypothetical protein